MKNCFDLPEGRCLVQLPEDLSQESIQDIGDWLELILRSLTRSKCVAVLNAAIPAPPAIAERNGHAMAPVLTPASDFEKIRDFIASCGDEPQTMTEIENATGISRHRLTTIIYRENKTCFFGTDFPGKKETAWALSSQSATTID